MPNSNKEDIKSKTNESEASNNISEFNEKDYNQDENLDNIDDLFDNREKPERKIGFLVGLFNAIENFSISSFKEKKTEKKEKKTEKKRKKKELKDSGTTIEDVQKQRSGQIKYVGYKIGLVGLFLIFVTVAIIVSLQDNEQKDRPKYNMKKILNDTTSFGKIGKKDYFLEQNILDDKINIVEKEAKKDRDAIRKKINEQTEEITKHIDVKFGDFSKAQTQYASSIKSSTEDNLKKQQELSESERKRMQATLKELAKKIEKIKKNKSSSRNRGFVLNGGKLSIPDFGNTEKKDIDITKAVTSSKNITSTSIPVIQDKDENAYETQEVDMMDTSVPELTFDTGINTKTKEKKDKGFEFDLTTTLVRVTLISGIKAPVLAQGMNNPTSVLMSIDGIAYSANDNKRIDFKGCLLQGVAVGNINTSRAEVFGTHLSCILEGDSGKKYKIEHVFPKNEVWIKGEDGSDGISGLIVDSSGKIMAKSAAIGFMQGVTNYFSAQNLVTGGLSTANNPNQSSVAQLGTSLQSGAGQGVSNGFDLIIKKYEELLQGYYPFIDVKGGRKNLTAVFGGGVTLKAVPYKDINLENY